MSDPSDHLVAVALRAGLIDPDSLRVIDLTGADADPRAFVAALKQSKPHFFAKQAKDMSPAERADALRAIAANPRPAPVRPLPAGPAKAVAADAPASQPKSAMVMLLEERAAFLREHAKKFPGSCEGMSYPSKSPWRD